MSFLPTRVCLGLLGSVTVLVLLCAPAGLPAQQGWPEAAAGARPEQPTRLADGRPGPGYWQQRVDYRLEAALEPASRRLRGSGWITYHNRSPHTLRELHWHLYQNLFRADAAERPRPWEVLKRVPTTLGITVQRVEAEGAPLTPEIGGTLMRTALPRPLAPGDSLRLRVEWEYEIPEGADLRTGSRDGAFGIAQWYPQIAVYDDLNGWDRTPYRGVGEFYLEYGDWDVRLNVPGDFVVAATGTLQNPEEVLTRTQQARLRMAPADTVIAVIPARETGSARGALAAERRTWHFRAKDVRDFAWAAAPDFVWEATRARGQAAGGALIQAFYRAYEGAQWEGGAAQARETIDFFAQHLGPYAYPQASVVSGPVTGMEYPMLAFVNPLKHTETLVHELAHQWYPMMLGSHEARHPYLDEGLATFATSLALDGPQGERSAGGNRLRNLDLYLPFEGVLRGTPVETPACGVSNHLSYMATAYLKPAAVMFMLRDVLGADTLDAALREYHRRWAFKHPAPDDLFRTVEDVAGRDLDWFWDQWIRGTAWLDLALDEVRQARVGPAWRAEVDVVNRGTARMPATVRLFLADGGRRDARVPVEAWARGAMYTLVVEGLSSRVVRVEIDPERVLLDVGEANDHWPFPLPVVAEASRIRQEVATPALIGKFEEITFHPSFSSNDVDGWELGFLADLRVGPQEAHLQSMLRVGLKNASPDIWLSYMAPLHSLGPTAAWGAQIMEMDGRLGADLEVQVATRPPGTRADSTVVDRRLWLGLHTVALHDAEFLPGWNDWDDGWHTAASARLRVPRPGWWGAGQSLVSAELGLPGSDRLYGTLSADLRTRLDLTESAALKLRSFAGLGLGDVPAQSLFYVAQASPWERFSRYRHVAGRGERSRLWGGGAVVGAAPEAGSDRIVAFNAQLEQRWRWITAETFADAGTLALGGLVGTEPWYADAGVGVGLRLPLLGDVRFRFPLWISDPDRPDADPWNLRWRVIVGGM